MDLAWLGLPTKGQIPVSEQVARAKPASPSQRKPEALQVTKTQTPKVGLLLEFVPSLFARRCGYCRNFTHSLCLSLSGSCTFVMHTGEAHTRSQNCLGFSTPDLEVTESQLQASRAHCLLLPLSDTLPAKSHVLFPQLYHLRGVATQD